ncbi:unnamed protein product [Chondrus crispus]|uniref:Zinc finger PHD-type domain-containing protein n=1 Tax=Chondrus crispus TaxID=2769 RepID=R7Q5Y1_CHOCR|nr:unnamed protein product [Chondrus crispus]CDF33927.1 unnamed protein product [Chondrus crispus]|eukprot:XP_005713746.1 unnamed protein product [Chondrus crispus]
MNLKAGSVVDAKKPGGRRKSAAVQEDARKGVDTHVKVKFKGDAIVYCIPWKDINAQHLIKAKPPNAEAAGKPLVVVINEENQDVAPRENVQSTPFAPTATLRLGGDDPPSGGGQARVTQTGRNETLYSVQKRWRFPQPLDLPARDARVPASSFTPRFNRENVNSPDNESHGMRSDSNGGPNGGLAGESPSRKHKESLLEFTLRSPLRQEKRDAPLYRFSDEIRGTPTSRPDSRPSQFSYPAKRQRTDHGMPGTNGVISEVGSYQSKGHVTSMVTPISRHPAGSLEGVSVSRYREEWKTAEYRIPRTRLQHQHNSELWPPHPHVPPPRGDFFASNSNRYRSITGSRVVENHAPNARLRKKIDSFRDERIISIKRQPASPVAKCFQGSEPFPREDPGSLELPKSSFEAMEICEKLIKESKESDSVDQASEEAETEETTIEYVALRSAATRRRCKSKPKRWRARALPHVRVSGLPQPASDQGTNQEELVACETSGLRICHCECGNPLGKGRALQCGMCGLWYHKGCVRSHDVIEKWDKPMDDPKLFMCDRCAEKVITEKSILARSKDDDISAQAVEKPESFFFAQTAIVYDGRGGPLTAPNHWNVMVTPEGRESRSSVAWRARIPLTENDINARAENVELLRAGVRRPSIGQQERDTIDSRFTESILHCT